MKKIALVIFMLLSITILLISCSDKAKDSDSSSDNGYVPAPIDTRKDTTDTSKNSDMPDDFSFFIVWGVEGQSSYDSITGKLLKTTYTENIDKFTANMKLSNEALGEIYYILFKKIDINSYPDTYDPFNNPNSKEQLMSCPSQSIVISVTANGSTKTISCIDIPLGSENECWSNEAKAFYNSIKEIESILTSSNEWKALPDYEVYFS